MTPAPAPDKLGIALRVGLFVIIGWITLVLVATMLYGFAGTLITSVISTFSAAALANAIPVRIYERGRLSDLGLAWTPTSLREFSLGAAAASAGAAIILTIPLIARIATLVRTPGVEHPYASFFFVTLVLLFGAVGEEMLFHGYAFQLLVRSIGAFATILPTSILFGIMHSGNPNATALSTLNTFLWGILFGFAYLRTAALWLPIGMHFGWNFTLPLFGANLSGFTMGVAGYVLHWNASDLWSGGGYGPEGSILTTAVVVTLFFVIHSLFPERLVDGA